MKIEDTIFALVYTKSENITPKPPFLLDDSWLIYITILNIQMDMKNSCASDMWKPGNKKIYCIIFALSTAVAYIKLSSIS
jgi:hypothetical protein